MLARARPGARSPSRVASAARSSSWSAIVPAAAERAEEAAAEARALLVGPVHEPHRDRRRALRGDPAQHLERRRRRSGSRRASRRSAPSRCGRRSASARSVAPRSVAHWLPACVDARPRAAGPVELRRAATPARAPTSSVHATRCAPFSSPVSSRSSRSSATVRGGIERHERESNGGRASVVSTTAVTAATVSSWNRVPPARGPSVLRAAAVRRGALRRRPRRALGALGGLHVVGETTELDGPFEVNDRTMPHLHEIARQLFEPSRRNGPLLITVLLDAALFTAKEAAVGLRARRRVGFAIARRARPLARCSSAASCRTSSPRRRCRSSRSRRWSSSG